MRERDVDAGPAVSRAAYEKLKRAASLFQIWYEDMSSARKRKNDSLGGSGPRTRAQNKAATARFYLASAPVPGQDDAGDKRYQEISHQQPAGGARPEQYIIIPTPLCPKACRTLILLTMQENRALAGRVKNPYRRSRRTSVAEPSKRKKEGLSTIATAPVRPTPHHSRFPPH
jgi:hypothetical protein